MKDGTTHNFHNVLKVLYFHALILYLIAKCVLTYFLCIKKKMYSHL